MSSHALLSPSASHRWLHCTAAPRLEEGIKDEGSDYAAEGTLAHAYCAMKLKEFLGLPTDGEKEEIAALQEKYGTGEMSEYTDTYATIVLEKFNAARAVTPDAQLLVETRLDFSDYVPDAFGTADAIIIADGTMEIIDFKYGKGVKVSAVENPQMLIYALGAYARFAFEYRIDNLRATIVQPRIDNLSEYEITVEELTSWASNVLTPAAEKAYKGEGPQTPGSWCQFCKVKNQCRALSDKCKAAVAVDPKLITPEELAKDVLPMVPIVKTWISGVEEFALAQALSGVQLPGWKIVEGRSIRKITDTYSVADALTKSGYTQSDIYKPVEMRTITELEKLVGKKQFAALCGEWVNKPQGKPTLAPESDKRKAIDPAADDFKDVNVD